MTELQIMLLDAMKIFRELSEESRQIAIENIENEKLRSLFAEYALILA